MNNTRTKRMVLSGLLCAVGIVIPMFAPKFVFEPASFTLGSHVAIFIAMFISPWVAVAVSLGTTAGFLLSGLPLVVVMRALTHIVFAFIGAIILKSKPSIIFSLSQSLLLSFALAVIHSLCEVAVVSTFFFGDNMAQGYYAKGFVYSVVLLVGVGTIVHSMVDFSISRTIWITSGVHKKIKLQ